MPDTGRNPFFDPAHPQRYYKGDSRAQANGRKGGLIGGAKHRDPEVVKKEWDTKREKKKAKEEAERFLDMDYSEFKAEASDDTKLDTRQKMVSGAILESAVNHDLKSTQYILQLVGEGPDNTQKVELTTQRENLENFLSQLSNVDVDLDAPNPDDE